MNNFKQTGNNIPVYIDELEAHITRLLTVYDKADPKPKHNPYKHPIIHTTSEGKVIQVPKDFQQKTIQKHMATKPKTQAKKSSGGYGTWILIIAALILMFYIGGR